MRTVQDEEGYLWVIGDDDPASTFLKSLDAGSVLPRRSILSGIVPRAAEWEAPLARYEKAYRATSDPDLQRAFLRAVRLWDTAVKLERLTK